MKIVFMGTPDFAAAHLEALVKDGFEVCAVFTQPDRQRSRGMHVSYSPVKETALENRIQVYQPETLKDGVATQIIRDIAPDLLVVVAYGKILPEDMISVPRLGTINVHASLLPKYRGSAPIQWSVLNGDRETGVTTMYIAPTLDTGDIIYQQKVEIGEYETSGELFGRLCEVGTKLLCRTVRDLDAGIAPRRKQDESGASYTTLLSKDMSPIDFSKPPRAVLKWIYGMQPWPNATMVLDGAKIRVLGAKYTENVTDAKPGTVLYAGMKGMEVACGGGGTILLTVLQSAGGRSMDAGVFLLGHPFRVDTQTWKR